jgi:hypothetical protein
MKSFDSRRNNTNIDNQKKICLKYVGLMQNAVANLAVITIVAWAG